MEEEIKNEVEVVEQPQEQQSQQPQNNNEEMDPQSKAALVAFILACVGFCIGFAWLFSIAAVVVGIIALNKLKGNDPETERQPFRVFGKIAKPLAIVDIVVGAGMFVYYLVTFIISVAAAIQAAVEAAA